MMATLRRLVDEPPQAMGSLNPELPPWFIAIVDRLLEKDPSRRFSSAKEVSELLEGCLAHLQQLANVPLPAGLAELCRPEQAPQFRHGWASSARMPELRSLFRPTRLLAARFKPVSRFLGVLAMIAALGVGLLGMFALQATAPPDISGNWQGEDWGQVVLTQTRGRPVRRHVYRNRGPGTGPDRADMVADRAPL